MFTIALIELKLDWVLSVIGYQLTVLKDQWAKLISPIVEMPEYRLNNILLTNNR
jgi:hypothetical protein